MRTMEMMRRHSGVMALGFLVLLGVGSSAAAIAADRGSVSAAQASEIALGQTGGGTIMEMDKHYRGGRASYYRFEIVSDSGYYHVEVDESTGQLLRFIQEGGRRGGRFGPNAGEPGNNVAAPDQTPTPGKTPVPGRTSPSGNAASGLTYQEALDAALARSGGGSVVESETDRKGYGRVVYEFEIINEGTKHTISVDSSNGAILKAKEKPARLRGMASDAAGAGTAARPSMGAVEAQAIAMQKAGGGNVTEYELDTDHGRWIHKINVINDGIEYEFEIGDASGEILKMEID